MRPSKNVTGGTPRRGSSTSSPRRSPACGPPDAERCVVAYEPIWAIGTGRNATPEDADATIGVIRQALRRLYGARPTRCGSSTAGSVKPGNIAELMRMPEIDGALVGGASLDPDDFARIVQYPR